MLIILSQGAVDKIDAKIIHAYHLSLSARTLMLNHIWHGLSEWTSCSLDVSVHLNLANIASGFPQRWSPNPNLIHTATTQLLKAQSALCCRDIAEITIRCTEYITSLFENCTEIYISRWCLHFWHTKRRAKLQVNSGTINTHSRYINNGCYMCYL